MSVSGVHCAYNVLFAVGVYDAFPSAILFPPVAASYHPLNVYPVRVGTGVVTDADVQSAVNVLFAEYFVFVKALVINPFAPIIWAVPS